MCLRPGPEGGFMQVQGEENPQVVSSRPLRPPHLTLACLRLSPTALSAVAQLCLSLCDPRDCDPPGSSVHWASPGKNTGVSCHTSSRASSQPRNQRSPTQVSHTAGGSFTSRATREAHEYWSGQPVPASGLFLTPITFTLGKWKIRMLPLGEEGIG